VSYDNSLVVTITVTCYSWAPSSGDHLFTCGVIHRPPHLVRANCFWKWITLSLQMQLHSFYLFVFCP